MQFKSAEGLLAAHEQDKEEVRAPQVSLRHN